MVKKASVVLSFDNRENAKAFFALLMTVDKRIKAMPVVKAKPGRPKKKAKEARPKKTKKTKKDDQPSPKGYGGHGIGLTIRGPFFIL